jgi:alkanesulfonate monooxygenase SsuD/methylene tetrahydromethanopterin reductase-like flavin-dependent oxidoreductase (luciferase family)
VNNLRRLGYSEDDMVDGGSDGLVDAIVPWGSTQDVANRLREHLEAGADHVCVQVVGAGQAFPVERYRELAGELALN